MCVFLFYFILRVGRISLYLFMKFELNWEDGGCEVEVVVVESGGDFDGRVRSVEICMRG